MHGPLNALAASDTTEIAKLIANTGPFGCGALFGGGLSYLFYKMATAERRERDKLEKARVEEMLKQLKEKDTRIDNLHDRITELLSEAPKPKNATKK